MYGEVGTTTELLPANLGFCALLKVGYAALDIVFLRSGAIAVLESRCTRTLVCAPVYLFVSHEVLVMFSCDNDCSGRETVAH